MEPTENSILDQTPIQSYPTVSSNQKRGGKKVWIFIILVAVAIAAFLFLRPSSNTTQTPEPTIEPTTPIEEPTITEDENTKDETTTPAPTKAQTSTGPSIQVQNGSGEEGVAGKMQTALSADGYDNVETGNADNFDYTDVTIKAKDSATATAKKIQTSLSGDYTVADEIGTLSDDSDYDIIVIVGK